MFGDLEPFGIVTRYVNKVTAEEIEPLINEKTKAVFAELIGNPGLEIAVHSHGVPLIIDSTTATPYLIQPFEHGADIVVHSSSKYINGGGNSISGIIVDSGNFEWNTERYKGLAEYKKFGRLAYVAKLRNGIWSDLKHSDFVWSVFVTTLLSLQSSLKHRTESKSTIPRLKLLHITVFVKSC